MRAWSFFAILPTSLLLLVFNMFSSLPFLSFIFTLLFSCWVVSDSLQPRGLQHARLPCPSLSPGVIQTHVHWVAVAFLHWNIINPLIPRKKEVQNNRILRRVCHITHWNKDTCLLNTRFIFFNIGPRVVISLVLISSVTENVYICQW